MTAGLGTRYALHMKRYFGVVLLFAGLAQGGLAADDWKQLFNGKDLDGWKHVGKGKMTVENGLIQTHGGMGLLYWTDDRLSNCVLRVVYKMRDTNDNSGVFIRIPEAP